MSILIFRRRHHTVPPFLVFSTQPGGANSGSPFSPQPVVTAKNPDGTTKTSFTGNVTLAVNTVTGSHALSGTVTVAAVAGVATFSGVTDTGSGDGTLTATAAGYSSATSASFTTAASGFTTITDSFTGTNGTALAGRTTDTGGKTWALDNGAAGSFALNGSNQVTSSATTIPVASVDAGVSDCTVSAKMVAFPGNQGLAFRVVDGVNFLRLNVAAGGDTIFIQEMVAASANNLATLSSTGLLPGDTLAVVLSGTSITVKINGTTKGSTTTSRFQTATKHGLCQIGTSGGVWDDFSITVP